MRERRDGDQPAAGRLDLEIEQRRNRGPVRVADLRNDLIAAIEVVETIDVAAAEQRAQLATDTREIEPQVRHLIAVDDDARLRQIDLQVRIDVQELAALPARTDDRPGGLEHLLGRQIARENQLDVILARGGQRRIEPREHLQPRHLRHCVIDLAIHLLGGA